MRIRQVVVAALIAASAACSGGNRAASNNLSSNLEAGLQNEDFNSTINSDDPVMNEADVRQLNGAGE